MKKTLYAHQRILRRARQMQGISQATLEDMTGLTSGSISRFETNEQLPHLHTLLLVAAELGVPLTLGGVPLKAESYPEDPRRSRAPTDD